MQVLPSWRVCYAYPPEMHSVSLEESGLPTTTRVPLSVTFHTPDLSARALTGMAFSESSGTTFMFPF